MSDHEHEGLATAARQQEQEALARITEKEREFNRLYDQMMRLVRFQEANPVYKITLDLLCVAALDPADWIGRWAHHAGMEVFARQQIAALDRGLPWLERYRAARRELVEGQP